MAKAIFERDFHWNRPRTGRGLAVQAIGFGAKASSDPQSFPRDFIDAAVAAGAAKEVRPKKQPKKPNPTLRQGLTERREASNPLEGA